MRGVRVFAVAVPQDREGLFLVCESYYAAIKTAPPSRIEAIDMGRRGLHNEGSKLSAGTPQGQDRSTSTPRGGCSR